MNNMSIIGSLTFSGLTDLTEIYLHSNNSNLSQLDDDLFKPLINLQRLKIHNNTYRNRSKYNGKLYMPLQKLEYLSLDGIPTAVFGEKFAELINIKTLNIKENQGYISNATFKAFSTTGLIGLHISSNLYDVEEMAFGHLTQLQTINHTYNMQLGFHNLSKAWYGSQYTDSNPHLRISFDFIH